MKILLLLSLLVQCLRGFEEVDTKKYAEMPDGIVIDTIDDFDDSGRTPLLHAARVGHLESILNILKVGANISKPSLYEDETAIFLAAEGGHDIVVSALIRAGADINYPNNLGITPIFAASQMGFTRTVKVLASEGASTGRISDGGLTPLMVAAIRGKHDTLKTLLSFDPNGVNMSSTSGETVLMSCVVARSIKCVEVAVEGGADLEAVDKKHRTAVMYAAIRNLGEILEFLVKKGAEIDRKDKYGQSALDLAYENQNIETTNVLLGAGVKITVNGGIRMSDEVRARRRATVKAREEAVRLEEERKKRILDFSQRGDQL